MSDEQKRPDPQIEEKRFALADSVRNHWAITVEGGEHKPTKEQILKSAFLAHVAGKLNPYDRIEVRCDDGSFFAELLVVKTDRAAATCAVLQWEELDSADDQRGSGVAGYEPKWLGPHRKWGVVRLSDKAIVYDGASSRSDAQFWVDNRPKAAA